MIEKTEKYVENALRNRPYTREDDNLLYVDVMRQIDPALVNVNFLMTFENARKKKLPAYETISRCRRKLQEKYPELEETIEVRKQREEQQMNMFEYAMKERWNK